MDEDAVPCDHVDPDFDDLSGAELDIREEFGGIASSD
jgi:hypothetical protein